MKQPELTDPHQPSRRHVLKSGAALAAGLAMPLRSAWGQTSSGFTRYNVLSSEGKQMLQSYQIAIGKLLKLPPTDSRNWYRNALVHLLDCPHGNWWLFPWHRAFIGWFEQTCRDMSGNPQFTFPYWDWTDTPMIPADFANGLLNPFHSAFIKGFDAFHHQFSAPMDALWAGLTQTQLDGLKLRKYESTEDVWRDIQGAFKDASTMPRFEPGVPFTDPGLVKATSLETILAGLKPLTYVPFSSTATKHHQGLLPGENPISGIIEGGPHNLVHNGTGGYMPDFLSPVDPLFFAHHSNLERLWCIWQARSGATLPEDAAWGDEPFTFFSDRDGKPVKQNTSGAYNKVGSFNYTYTPGSCSEVVNKVREPQSLQGTARVETLASLTTDAAHVVNATIILPPALLTADSQTQTFLLHVTVSMGEAHQHGESFDVYLNLPLGVKPTPDRAEFVGSLEFFGSHKHPAGTSTTFTLPILSSTATATALKSSKPIHVQVVPAHIMTMAHPMTSDQPPSLTVTAVSLTTS